MPSGPFNWTKPSPIALSVSGQNVDDVPSPTKSFTSTVIPRVLSAYGAPSIC